MPKNGHLKKPTTKMPKNGQFFGGGFFSRLSFRDCLEAAGKKQEAVLPSFKHKGHFFSLVRFKAPNPSPFSTH